MSDERLSTSAAFEQVVARAVAIIEGQGTKVSWNKKVPDPSEPSRARQIDVHIERGSASSAVECRQHDRPQDVKWIEELIGRRQSLGLSSIAAASTSGFTDLAKRKAEDHCIPLIDLRDSRSLDEYLSEREVVPFIQYVQLHDFCLHFHGKKYFWFNDALRATVSRMRSPLWLDLVNSLLEEFQNVQLNKTLSFHAHLDPRSCHPIGIRQTVEVLRASGTASRHEIASRANSLSSIESSSLDLPVGVVDFPERIHQIYVLGNKVHHHLDFSRIQLPPGAVLIAFGLRTNLDVECTAPRGNVLGAFRGLKEIRITVYNEDRRELCVRRDFARIAGTRAKP